MRGDGYPFGETHHRAKLSTADVEMIRELREEHGLTYEALSRKFEVAYATIRDICKYKTRCYG